MKTKLAVLMLLASSSMFAASHFSIGVNIGGYGYGPGYGGYYIATPPPPPPVYYYAPPRPGPGYTWISGYYYPVGARYQWRAGYWTRPPYRNARWVGPRYERGRYYGGRWR
jgi:hypothetical protein